MLPFCYPLFEDLGVLEELKRTFVRKPGVRFIHRDGVATTSWCFGHVIPDETYLSFQVNRAPFDQILLENSRRNGAEVHEETKVEGVDLTDPEMVVVRTSGPDGERVAPGALPGGRQWEGCPGGEPSGLAQTAGERNRTALWSHWEGVTMQGGLEEGLSLIIYMGEEKKGWISSIPADQEPDRGGVVVDNSYLREQKRLLQGAGSTDWMLDLCMQELEQSSFVNGLLEGTTRALPIMVNGNYSYEVKNDFGSNYAMVGDARGFIDPIFSSGVFLSIKTSYLVSDAVDGLLAGDAEAPRRMADAYEKVTGAYNFVHRMIKLFYNPHAVTWAQVGEEGEVHRAHQSAMAAGHFMLSGGFFKDHDRFNRFFTLLEDPKQFHRYATTVIERSAYHDTSCHASWETAFGGLTMEPAPASA